MAHCGHCGVPNCREVFYSGTAYTSFTSVRQLPQIWDEYCTGDPEVVRLQRLGDFKLASVKRKEITRKKREAAKAAVSENAPRRSVRKRKRTECAAVRPTNLSVP